MSSSFKGENDNFHAEARVFGPSRSSLLRPVLVVLCAWILVVIALRLIGRSDSTFGQVAIACMLLALTLTGANAILRLWTVGVRFEPQGVVLRRGFPKWRPVVVPWHDIADVNVTGYGLLRRRSLVVEDADGRHTEVRDVAAPEKAASLIRDRMGQFQGVAALLGGLSALGRTGRG
jgi:uncharacterized membrane protein YdbT with pleckstrin-like domain